MRNSIRRDSGLAKGLTLQTEDIAILFLASQGLLLLELLNLSFLTPGQIRKMSRRMLQMVEELDKWRTVSAVGVGRIVSA